MRFAKGCAHAATSVQAATMLAAIARVEAEEKAKRQDQARSLFRGPSLAAEMCMSMNTEKVRTSWMISSTATTKQKMITSCLSNLSPMVEYLVLTN